MKISINTVAELNEEYNSAPHPAEHGVDKLVEVIGSQLGAVETVEFFGEKYEGVVLAQIQSCEKHPNADRLSVCMIDDGGVIKDVQRDNQGLIQVVCGASNVREGLMVAWLPPGSTVPESYEKDPFVLDARELRGVLSNGMLASPKELSINDSHEGILEIADDIQPGTYLVDAVGLRDDRVIDIENKMFTHRPDCFGWLGVAREIAGIQHHKYNSPQWYTAGSPSVYEVRSDSKLPLVIQNAVPELVPRFIAVTLSDVTVKQSPLFLQFALLRHGIRPINNVVDITNYIMLLTGQPLHAYDYDKVRAIDTASDTATIGARHPYEDESLTLLNGKEIKPRKDGIVITTAQTAIGLGGVMGGSETEVDETTRNIILECATFDMYSIRRTAMAHGLFTDAVTRFNKGQSPLQNKVVAEKAVAMLIELAGAKVADFIDDTHISREIPTVHVGAPFINERLGLHLSAEDIKSLLTNVEFGVSIENDTLQVSVPFWRTDIEIAEDIVEEVGRLYGYDLLLKELPVRSIAPTVTDPLLTFKQQVRDNLVRAGAHETLTYSFVHGKLLHAAGQGNDKAFKLSNALSPDLQYYRMSVQPSLLEKVHMNVKAGYDEFALFEIGKGHAIGMYEDELPAEWTNVALVYAADSKVAQHKVGAAFYQARKLAVELLDRLGCRYELMSYQDTSSLAENLQLAASVYEGTRTALVVVNNQVVGFVGEYKATVRKHLKLPDYVAGFELSLEGVMEASTPQAKYVPLSKYPKVEQDITLQVHETVEFGKLERFLQQQLIELTTEHENVYVTPKDIYQAKDSDMKRLTFRITVTSYEKTKTDDEVVRLLDNVASLAAEQFKAQRI